MKVLIADDQARVRSALKVLLEQEDGLTVAGEAKDIESLLAGIEKCHPEAVLLDWELAGGSMAGLIPVLRRNWPGLAIVAMSVRPEAERPALEAGVDAFASKGKNSDGLLKIINDLKNRGSGVMV